MILEYYITKQINFEVSFTSMYRMTISYYNPLQPGLKRGPGKKNQKDKLKIDRVLRIS